MCKELPVDKPVHPNVILKEHTNIYEGFISVSSISIQHKLYDYTWSPTLNRELIRRPPSVGVLLYDPNKKQVVLVEQFRLGAFFGESNPWTIETVAGIKEQGEQEEETAFREAVEESGCHIKKLIPITEYYTSPAFMNEKVKLFCGLVEASTAKDYCGVTNECEDIKVHTIPVNKAYSMLEKGIINNGLTIIAIQWLKIHEEEL